MQSATRDTQLTSMSISRKQSTSGNVGGCCCSGCNSQICCSYVLCVMASVLVVGGAYLSFKKWDTTWLILSIAGLVLIFIGSCLYYCGHVSLERSNKLATKRRHKHRHRSSDNLMPCSFGDRNRSLSQLSLNMIPQYFSVLDTQSVVSSTATTPASAPPASLAFSQIFSVNGQSFLILPLSGESVTANPVAPIAADSHQMQNIVVKVPSDASVNADDSKKVNNSGDVVSKSESKRTTKGHQSLETEPSLATHLTLTGRPAPPQPRQRSSVILKDAQLQTHSICAIDSDEMTSSSSSQLSTTSPSSATSPTSSSPSSSDSLYPADASTSGQPVRASDRNQSSNLAPVTFTVSFDGNGSASNSYADDGTGGFSDSSQSRPLLRRSTFTASRRAAQSVPSSDQICLNVNDVTAVAANSSTQETRNQSIACSNDPLIDLESDVPTASQRRGDSVTTIQLNSATAEAGGATCTADTPEVTIYNEIEEVSTNIDDGELNRSSPPPTYDEVLYNDCQQSQGEVTIAFQSTL